MTSLGRFLRKLRIDHDEILFDMAKRLGVSPSFLSAVENGKKTPPVGWFDQLTVQYNLDPSQQNELRNALNDVVSQIRLNISKQTAEKRDLVLAFARRFESLSNEEADAVLKILNRHNNNEE